ncbi:MAG: methionine adenosyltransferase [Candidatus Marinimicrobia bacterium]|nr:methionine adenosyltransferase [Candidatus Neomarinimicrobiota bacterium]
MIKKGLFSSESVTEGHPDKICDQISDGILDKILENDPNARVACETLVTTDVIYISGEITTTAKIEYSEIAKNVMNEIGYNPKFGVDLNNTKIYESIDQQSVHIAQGVDKDKNKEQGAGDQGLMFGYACNETEELMPIPIQISHDLTRKLAEVRKNSTLNWLGPDGKSQVTVRYEDGQPVEVVKVVIATQHTDMLNKFKNEIEECNFIKSQIIEKVILPVLKKYKIKWNDDFIINGTGRFVVGGPIGDTGLTGRKIIVDTYGGYAKHGGGAFSGKDASKVDRSAAYMARYIAKNIVASKLADHCEVQLAYSIGVAEPVSLLVDTMGTGKISDEKIIDIVKKVFPLKPEEIIDILKLKTPFYQPLATYGHFGRDDYPWEKTDMIDEINKRLEELSK